MKIELVSHCYAKNLPHFAACLCFQASSILKDQPKNCEVELGVWTTMDDMLTIDVAAYFQEIFDETANIKLEINTLEPEKLWKRCIGRNLAAKYTDADIVWFTDVDHCFQDGIFDSIAEMVNQKRWPYWGPDPNGGLSTYCPSRARMIYPKRIMIQESHEVGDARLAGVISMIYGNNHRDAMLDKSEFVQMKYNRAIGGVQIVEGDYAREHGYLDNTKWQSPVDTPFPSFRDDVKYRKQCKQRGEVIGVDLPGVYRLRHSETTYQGK